MNLDDMVRLATEQAQRILIGSKDELVPMWLILTGDGNIEIIGTVWHGDQEKYLAVEHMRGVMREKQCIAYSLLVEAWFTTVSKEQGESGDYVRPSESPDRKECVCAMAANHWGQHKYKQLEIIRDRKGRCKELRPIHDFPEDQISSPLFDGLLKPKGRPN